MNANVATPSDANLRIRGKNMNLLSLIAVLDGSCLHCWEEKKKLKMDFSSLSFHNVCLNRMRRYILMEIS